MTDRFKYITLNDRGKVPKKLVVDFSRVTIQQFLLFITALDEHSFQDVIQFCDTVIVGGLMGRSLDDLGGAMAEVSKQLSVKMDIINKEIETARLLGDIDKHLDLDDK